MKTIARWSISNSPAMNVIMVLVLVVGWIGMQRMQRESFPSFDLELVLVSVPYPGAAPEEVEEGICQKIEEAIRSVEGIKKVTSVAAEGVGSVVIELKSSVRSPDRVVDEVRSEIDRIPSFPQEAEDPEVNRVTTRRAAIRVAVVAPEGKEITPMRLREVAERARDELLSKPEISVVEIQGSRAYQIDIEVSEDVLRAHGLTLQQVASAIRRENRELPAGTIRGESQEILLRGNNRQTDVADLEQIPLVTQLGGAVLTVGDLGVVRDGFEDRTSLTEVNGRPALALSVERTANEDLFQLVDVTRDYVKNAQLPAGFDLMVYSDQSIEVRGRLDLLVNNGAQGLVLVFLLLVLFLDLRLAFWVAMGIPFAVLATGAYLYATDQSLNMISMFAFVMALGIVVDDAIVVGENIFAHREMGKNFAQAALDGTVEVMPSVLASVSTTIVAFAPLLFVTGTMGKFMAVMPAAIIGMLVASLFECTTILPAHLAHRNSLLFKFIRAAFFPFLWVAWLIGFGNKGASNLLERFVRNVYVPLLRLAVGNRLVVVSLCVGCLIVAWGLKESGITPFVLFPKLDSNTISAKVTFPDGTPEEVTDQWTRHIERAFWRVADDVNEANLATLSIRKVGSQSASGGPGAAGRSSASGSHVGAVEIELARTEDREISSEEVVKRWREEIGIIPGVETLAVASRNFGPGGIPIEFKVLASKANAERLELAVERCKAKLAEYRGVKDIADDSIQGKWEFRFRVKEEARAMGVKTADVAETVRAAYYGEEVMRVQRGRHEVKIMVRYPQKERRNLANFDDIRIRLEDGVERPITELVEVDTEQGYSEINRINQMRSITVTADIDEKVANASEIVEELKREFTPQLAADLPGVRVLWEGQQAQTDESLGSLQLGFLVAVFVMYMLLCLEFKSYLQPLLILCIIPFGMVGAIAGHAVMGIPITMFSMFGIVALTGIVVNDSIVLVDFIKARLRDGEPIGEAVVNAGERRFRPVMLTTVTTIGGLLPILMETSLQAQVLIPMATSIAFGEMFATVLVLFLVPVVYSLYNSFMVDIAPWLGFEHEDDEELQPPSEELPVYRLPAKAKKPSDIDASA